jgi:DnaK suppressor protein
MLTERRLTLLDEVRTRLHAGRTRGAEGRDSMELVDDDIRDDVSFALIQMTSESLAHVEAAIARLDSGHYGTCESCDQPIPSPRLRAMPFAVRCQPCADRRERRAAIQATPTRWGAMGDAVVGRPSVS